MFTLNISVRDEMLVYMLLNHPKNIRIIFQHEKEVFKVYKLSECAKKINSL